jgi:hypothetical protein
MTLLMGGFGCHRPAAGPPDDDVVVPTTKAAPSPGSAEETIQKWARAIEGTSPDELLGFYAPAGDLSVTFSSGYELRGFAALKQEYTSAFREIAASNSEVTDLVVKQEKDTASVTCRHRAVLHWLADDMKWLVDVHTAFDLEKHKGWWKIVREKSSPIPGVPRLQPVELRLALDIATAEGFSGKIESIGDDDTLKVNAGGVYKGTGPSERTLFGLVIKDRRPTKLFRVLVSEDKGRKTATIRVAHAAAERLRPGEEIRADKTMTWIDSELKSLPDFVDVKDARKPDPAVTKEDSSLKSSLNNLKQIGIALHNWADIHNGRLPPAVIHGPDGKPWHSWRVLILPLLEQDNLFKLYRFDEPWDGPNNKRLLEMVVPLYRDPIHGDTRDPFTHIAAVTGPGTVFPSEGIKVDDPKQLRLGSQIFTATPGLRRFTDIKDGLSNTLVIGSVSPQHKIPWTKPQDIPFKGGFPTPGKPGSFAAPHRLDGKAAGAFLFADASVRTIPADIDQETWRSLWLIADGKPAGGKDIPRLPEPPAVRQEEEHAIRLGWRKGSVSAKYVIETVPARIGLDMLDMLPVGIKVVHEPNPVRVTVTGKGEQRGRTWWYKTSVSATGGPVQIESFGAVSWQGGQWRVWRGPRDSTPRLFARWFSCPEALLKPGMVYVDRTASIIEPKLHEGKTRLYFIGTDNKGRLVKGESVLELQAGPDAGGR